MLFVLPMVYCVCTGRLILRVRMYRAFTVMPEPKVTWNKITRGRRSIGMHVTGEEREKRERKRYFTERWAHYAAPLPCGLQVLLACVPGRDRQP